MEPHDKDQSGPSDDVPKVMISVRGGVADILFKPKGIAVVVFDYDTDGHMEPQKDPPNGANCSISTWQASEQIIYHPHGPMSRDARPDATDRCNRKWQCPTCCHMIELSYEQIVEVGTPSCPYCETEMRMI